MSIYTIDRTIEYIKIVMKRELTDQEILIVGLAFQNGILRGIEEEKKSR